MFCFSTYGYIFETYKKGKDFITNSDQKVKEKQTEERLTYCLTEMQLLKEHIQESIKTKPESPTTIENRTIILNSSDTGTTAKKMLEENKSKENDITNENEENQKIESNVFDNVKKSKRKDGKK